MIFTFMARILLTFPLDIILEVGPPTLDLLQLIDRK